MTCLRSLVALLSCLVLLSGCGSGKGSGSRTTPVKLSIVWSQRSRAVNAPTSALSAIVTLAKAGPAGADFIYSVNREAAPQTYTGNYTTLSSAKIGVAPFTIRFYAQPNGTGAVVGIAQATVTIKADGTGIGSVSTANTIASVAITAGQKVRVGQTTDLAFTALDAQGNMVAVTPGSAAFTVAGGADKLQIVNGQAKGIAVGTAAVSVMLDGKAGANTDVAIAPLTPTAYTFTDLGTLPGDTESGATSINSQGTIVGYSYRASSGDNNNTAAVAAPHAVIWRNGVIADMGILSSGDSIMPVQINDVEQVTGTIGNRSFYWANGLTTDLGMLSGADYISARSINNNGVIVGYAISNTGLDYHAFTWQKGSLTDLGAFKANAINDAGVITGESAKTEQQSGQAITWQNGVFTNIGPDIAGEGTVINAAGHVAGDYYNYNIDTFLWKDGAFTDPGMLTHRSAPQRSIFVGFIVPYSLNDSDQVVGEGGLSPIRSDSYAFLYSEGKLVDLSTFLPANSGWDLARAKSINNNGMIVGEGTINGHTRAFLLTPQ